MRKNGICLLTFDRPNSVANIFDLDTLRQLDAELELIEHTPQVKGVVLHSAKKTIFIAGARSQVPERSRAGGDARDH